MVLSVALGSSPPLVLVDMLLGTHSADLQGPFSVRGAGLEGVAGRETQELPSKGTVTLCPVYM